MDERDGFGSIYESQGTEEREQGGRLRSAGRLVLCEFARLLAAALVLAGLGAGVYGLAQAKDTIDRWGWVEADGVVIELRTEFNGLWYERSVVVESGETFVGLPRDSSVETGDEMAFYVDPRDSGAYDVELGLPLREGSLTSWRHHAARAVVALIAAAVGFVGGRRLWHLHADDGRRHEHHRSG